MDITLLSVWKSNFKGKQPQPKDSGSMEFPIKAQGARGLGYSFVKSVLMSGSISITSIAYNILTFCFRTQGSC